MIVLDNFNPRSPWGERPKSTGPTKWCPNFNPRSPWGERHGICKLIRTELGFQSTLPVGGATSSWAPGWVMSSGFQSTLPVGGATGRPEDQGAERGYFNPRSPWGERLPGVFVPFLLLLISIHAPRGGSDTLCTASPARSHSFQSTLPVGGATFKRRCLSMNEHISIHAPRGGSDSEFPAFIFLGFGFQSTLPVGGATLATGPYTYYHSISIHAPRGGSDGPGCPAAVDNPISIHAPRGGSDDGPASAPLLGDDFNPRSPWGERRCKAAPDIRPWKYFNPRSPWGERRRASFGPTSG